MRVSSQGRPASCRINNVENDRLKGSYMLMKGDTAHLEQKMRQKVAANKELLGRKLNATLN
jgi:hypothetical protein